MNVIVVDLMSSRNIIYIYTRKHMLSFARLEKVVLAGVHFTHLRDGCEMVEGV